MSLVRRFALVFALSSLAALLSSDALATEGNNVSLEELEARADELLVLAEATLEAAEGCPDGACPERARIEADMTTVEQKAEQVHLDRAEIEPLPPGSDLDAVIRMIDDVEASLVVIRDGWDIQS